MDKFESLPKEKEQFSEYFEQKIDFLKTQRNFTFELFSLEIIQKVKEIFF